MQNPTPIPYDIAALISDSPELRPAADDNWQARRELASALRRLNSAALTADAPTDMLRSVAAAVQAEAERIEANPKLVGKEIQAGHTVPRQVKNPHLFYDVSPAIGQSNAIAPPMYVWHADGRVHAEATPGWAYEGPPGCVHGGIIALLFDHLLGVRALLTGRMVRTGTLTIRYHHPTPLHKTLRLTADIDRVEDRKHFIVGKLWADDVCTASCEGIFIATRQHPAADA